MLTGQYKRQDFENDLKIHMGMKDLLVYKNLIETIDNSKWENLSPDTGGIFSLIFCWNVFVLLQTAHLNPKLHNCSINIYPSSLLRKIKHLFHASPVIGSDNPRKKTAKFLSYRNSESWK